MKIIKSRSTIVEYQVDTNFFNAERGIITHSFLTAYTLTQPDTEIASFLITTECSFIEQDNQDRFIHFRSLTKTDVLLGSHSDVDDMLTHMIDLRKAGLEFILSNCLDRQERLTMAPTTGFGPTFREILDRKIRQIKNTIEE